MASVEFDEEVSALYLRLRRGKTASSEPLADNIVLDRDENERVIGLEILLPPTIKNEVKAQISRPASRRHK